MQIKLKKKELTPKLAAFNAILTADIRPNAFVEYWAVSNRKILAAKVEEIEAVEKSQLKDFYLARQSLNEKLSDKDEAGKPIIDHGQYKMTDTDTYVKEYNEMALNFKTELEGFNAFLDEEITVELETIELKKIENLEFARGVVLELYDLVTK